MTTFAQPFQDYEILDRVGGGAMGTVFKARHKKLGRIVALKVLKPSLARDRRYVDRLRREARIVASLSHPNIVTGYDLGEEGGYHFFVMEFVEGKSLRQLLVEWGMFAEAYVLKVARQVAEALDHAYQRGVIHRDIKPGNILIDEAGNVKLTDMGLAKGPADLSLTRDGATVGTPMYISPEQARNPQDVDVRTDLYSLGGTLYHMATGVPPFRGETMAALITSVLNDNVVPPDEANSAVSAPVSLVIRKLLAKNLSVRYQTPRELLDDLDRIERSQPPAVDVRRLDQLEDAAPWQRWLLYAAATLVLCGFAWWGGQQMVAPSAPEVSSEQFLRELDADLAALPTPGARFDRLRTIAAPAPGSLLGLEQRRRTAQLELQHAVDGVVDTLLTRRWEQVVAWLRDRATWPDQHQFEVRFLEPDLQVAAGLPLAQLPGQVRTQRLDELRRMIGRELEKRDAQFNSDFDQFLGTRLPALAEDRLRVGDFAAADRLWRDGLSFFCDGLQQPLPERLGETVRRALRDRHQVAWRAAQTDLERAEQAVTMALHDEVEQTMRAFAERLDDGVDAALVAEALQRFRDDLLHYWPASTSFRVGSDPWPGVEQALRATSQRIDLAAGAALARHFEKRCELAWQAFCRGRGADALAVLEGCEPATEEQQRALAAHRRQLDAAVRVEQALLTTIAGARVRPVGFLLDGDTAAIELSAAIDGETLRLIGQVVGQGPRAMRLSELRLGDLLDRLAALDDAPLREMPTTPRSLGLAALRLVGEDLDGIAGLLTALPASDRSFLQDVVWPLVERVRAATGPDPLEPRQLFAELEEALVDVEQTGAVEKLRGALIKCNQLTEAQCTTAELRLRRQAGQRLTLALRQRDVSEELRDAAPRGALVDVRVDGRDIIGGVTLPAEVLRGDAGDGWLLRDDTLQFAGGARPWSEQQHLALVANAGLGVDADRTVALVDLVFPSSRVGRRIYLMRFRGIGLAVVLTASDAIHVALVDGDVLREDRAQRAFETALAGGFAPPRKLVVPGGVHRLKFEVAMLASGTQAAVRIELEGTELLSNPYCEVDRSQPPVLALHPLQEIAVQKVTLQVLERQ